MSAPIDCPICMDFIESTTKNYVTTECGHCFHTNCLMQSVAHNGFGCPYCRTSMAKEAMAEEFDEEESDEESDEGSLWFDMEEREFEENTMRGFRFFWNNLNNDSHDDEDNEDENEFEEEAIDQNQNHVDPSIPTTDFVAQKLCEQGVTFEQLVKIICQFDDHGEYDNDEADERLCDELYGKIRVIITNYTPPVQEPTPVQELTPEVNFAAQPKTQVRSVPRYMIRLD